MGRSDAASPLQTVDRALQILGLFSPVCPELSVAQVARVLEIDRSIASRLLAALELRRFVVQDPQTDRFRLGVRTLELGALFVQSHRLVTAATPYLKWLSEGEEPSNLANLFVLDDGQALRLTSYPARPLTRLQVPATCTASGKVLLAALSDQAIDQILAERGLPARTPHSITDPTVLRECLAEVRQCGYAADAQEIVLGSFCYAAPIHDATGATVGAVSIGYEAARPATLEREIRLIEAVCEAGRRISESLGSGVLTTGAMGTRQPEEVAVPAS